MCAVCTYNRKTSLQWFSNKEMSVYINRVECISMESRVQFLHMKRIENALLAMPFIRLLSQN